MKLSQLYLSVLSDDTSVAIERLDACFVDVKAWLRASSLRLNPAKTQVMWLGSGQQLAKVYTDKVHRESMSSMLREILTSSLTASCRCQHRF